MPGSHLNDTEKALVKLWSSTDEPFGSFPTLRELEISGDPGLRGIKELKIQFNYPLTVLCGRNGTGKSTILALSVLGFHYNNPATSSADIGEPGYYTFRRFFYKGPGDPDITGLQITWHYGGTTSTNNKKLAIRKRSEKWMHYERRPHRPVYYLGLQRCIPPIEQTVLRHYFGGRRKADATKPLNQEYLSKLGYIGQALHRG